MAVSLLKKNNSDQKLYWYAIFCGLQLVCLLVKQQWLLSDMLSVFSLGFPFAMVSLALSSGPACWVIGLKNLN